MHLKLLLGTLISYILCASNALDIHIPVSPTEALQVSGSGLEPKAGHEDKANIDDPSVDAGSGIKPPGPTNPLENPDLFEGDLKIPKELIEKYYGKTNGTKLQVSSCERNLMHVIRLPYAKRG